MRNTVFRRGACLVAALVAVASVGTGAATATPELNPDQAGWWTSAAPGPDLQFRVTKVVETSDFAWDWGYLGGHPDARTWPRPVSVVGDGVPATARASSPEYAPKDTTVMKPVERISGDRYRLTVPGAILDTVLEPRSGW